MTRILLALAILLGFMETAEAQSYQNAQPSVLCTYTPTGTQCTGISATNPLPVTDSSSSVAGITPIVSTAAESGHILKASGGNLYGLVATAQTATAGYVMVFNSATVPADGTVTPVLCLPINATPGFASVSYNPGPPGAFSTGISVAISSTGCATKTAIAAGAWFTGAVQ